MKIRLLSAFKYPGYSVVLLNSVLSSMARYLMLVALGWAILELTDSAFYVGLVWACLAAPNAFFGAFAGVIVDRFDRRRLLIMISFVSSLIVLVPGILILMGALTVPAVLIFVGIFGSVSTIGLPARQTLIVDIVGQQGAMNAISVSSMGGRVIGLVGGMVAGVVIEFFGIEWCFFIMALTHVLSGIVLVLKLEPVERANSPRTPVLRAVTETFRLLRKNTGVLALGLIAVFSEIFGFSMMVLLPVFARDILQVGALGLGSFYTAEAFGGLLGGLALASLGNKARKGMLLLGVFLFFGILLILFSQSIWYSVSLVLLGMIGAACAATDALQHTLLQQCVPDSQRGQAMGIWMISVGFGPVGTVLLGVVASLVGAPLAVTLNGGAMIVIFAFLATKIPVLRRM